LLSGSYLAAFTVKKEDFAALPVPVKGLAGSKLQFFELTAKDKNQLFF